MPVSYTRGFGIEPLTPLKELIMGYPALLIVWAHLIWFIYTLYSLCTRPITRSQSSIADSEWLMAVLPVMYLPTTVVFAYCCWVGWKFFQRN